MFARNIRVEYVTPQNDQRVNCLLKWLDNFAMRNFTNATAFDDTLPIADGELEIGANVPLDKLREAMEDWFKRKGYIPKDASLSLREV